MPPAGLEPARLTARDFKSLAATDFAKGAAPRLMNREGGFQQPPQGNVLRNRYAAPSGAHRACLHHFSRHRSGHRRLGLAAPDGPLMASNSTANQAEAGAADRDMLAGQHAKVGQANVAAGVMRRSQSPTVVFINFQSDLMSTLIVSVPNSSRFLDRLVSSCATYLYVVDFSVTPQPDLLVWRDGEAGARGLRAMDRPVRQDDVQPVHKRRAPAQARADTWRAPRDEDARRICIFVPYRIWWRFGNSPPPPLIHCFHVIRMCFRVWWHFGIHPPPNTPFRPFLTKGLH